MQPATTFVQILLPLNLWESYTYVLPEALKQSAMVGKRAVVQFGKSKLYTGLIVEIHGRAPVDFIPKPIEEIIDEMPLVHPIQIEFWQWISAYYLSPLGNVLAAVLPSGLKLSSESVLCFNDAVNYTELMLTDDEFIVAEALSIQREIAVGEIKKIANKKNIFNLIKGLLQKKVAFTQETLKDKYHVKYETVVRLNRLYTEKTALKSLFDQLEKKSDKQLNLLMHYLQANRDNAWMSKSDLIIKADSSASVLEAMVKKHIFETEKQSVSRLKKYQLVHEAAIHLSVAQLKAKEEILQSFAAKQTVLFQGVTGSGKTEVYIELLKHALAAGKKALYLLPEIALTAQIVQRLERYFGDDIMVYHSKCNEAERVELWYKVYRGEYKIVLGARSALLLPFSSLGLIIIDEEHDSSFKQADPDPRYHARDAALFYGSLFKANVLLGSATPSTDSYYNAHTKKYGYVQLAERYGNSVLPEIELIDMKLATHQKSTIDSFSKKAVEAIKAAMANNKQSILFQNRRGYAPYLECKQCAWIPMCKFCDVGLTYHKGINQLVCHYCNARSKVPNTCNACKSAHLQIKGLGTEKVEDEIKQLLPEARIERMDFDTTRGKDAHQVLFKKLENREIDILVGTQMLTKGLDFEHVHLVVVVNADNLIFMPDYRINERAFQTLCQVAGRAGRGDLIGKVLIQTNHPKHPVFHYLLQHDVNSFLKDELRDRLNFSYPPYVRMIKITMKYKDEQKLEEWSQAFVQVLKESIDCTAIGPSKPIVSKIQNLYYREVLLKFKKDTQFIAEKHKLLQLMKTKPYEPAFRNLLFAVHVDI